MTRHLTAVPTTTPLAALHKGVGRVLEWCTQHGLPDPAETTVHRVPRATGTQVTFILADLDDLRRYATAMGQPVEEGGGMAWALGELYDLPVFCRCDVEVQP